MIAVISDIHANYNALRAVLQRIGELGADRVISLGDLVGYGSEPVACVDEVRRRCSLTLCGNHDFALIYGANDFTDVARSSIEQHRRLMMPGPQGGPDAEGMRDRWHFLKSMPFRHVLDGWLFVHASPRNPVMEYLRKMDVLLGMTDKLGENFRQVDWLCFIGHTHQPGVITRDLRFYEPAELKDVFAPRPHEKAIINVGSVGQPRDGDWRACFVTVDDDSVVRYHRVEYDVESAAAGLDEAMADRLRRGR